VSKLILWDIDGTLLSVDYLGKEVFERALYQAYGLTPSGTVRMSGKTDPQIIKEYFDMMQIPEKDYVSMTDEVLAYLEIELAKAEEEIRKVGSLKENVVNMLQYLSVDDDIIQTVLTGNIIRNAKLKLEIFSLLQYIDFDCGAFGSDNIDRTKLVDVALGRVYEKHGISPNPKDTWIIGDSPNDLACAKASGIGCILVATGRFEFEELSTLGADLVCHNLEDKEIFNLLGA